MTFYNNGRRIIDLIIHKFDTDDVYSGLYLTDAPIVTVNKTFYKSTHKMQLINHIKRKI